MATTMVAEQEGSARSKALMAQVLEAVVALLSRSSGCSWVLHVLTFASRPFF